MRSNRDNVTIYLRHYITLNMTTHCTKHNPALLNSLFSDQKVTVSGIEFNRSSSGPHECQLTGVVTYGVPETRQVLQKIITLSPKKGGEVAIVIDGSNPDSKVKWCSVDNLEKRLGVLKNELVEQALASNGEAWAKTSLVHNTNEPCGGGRAFQAMSATLRQMATGNKTR